MSIAAEDVAVAERPADDADGGHQSTHLFCAGRHREHARVSHDVDAADQGAPVQEKAHASRASAPRTSARARPLPWLCLIRPRSRQDAGCSTCSARAEEGGCASLDILSLSTSTHSTWFKPSLFTSLYMCLRVSTCVYMCLHVSLFLQLIILSTNCI